MAKMSRPPIRSSNKPKNLPSKRFGNNAYMGIRLFVGNTYVDDIVHDPIFHDRRFRYAFRLYLSKVQTILLQQLQRTVKTWKDPVQWHKLQLSLSGQNMHISVFAYASEAADHWRWLDEGTQKRWALMSRYWQSKTAPITDTMDFNSIPGRGKVVVKGKVAFSKIKLFGGGIGLPAQPGIDARGWSDTLRTVVKHQIKTDLTRILSGEFNRRLDQSITTPSYYSSYEPQGDWIDLGKKGVYD